MKLIRRIVGLLTLALAVLAASLVILMCLTGWRYSDLPMVECAWCKQTTRLERHHIVPQAVDASLINEPTNLIVLCQPCHRCLGHRHNTRTYNPDVGAICATFTNSLPIVRKEKLE